MPTNKVLGTVKKMGELASTYQTAPTYCFAVDDWGVWHHVHKKNVSRIGRLGWDDVKPGSRLKFLSVESQSGKYSALEVEVISVD